MTDILLAVWFMLPAAAANAVPVFSASIPLLKKWSAPIDGGKKWRGHEIFGPHKTWRGMFSGILAATVVFWLQQLAFNEFFWVRELSTGVPYDVLPALLMGPLFAIGALGGDAVESFFKRRRGVPSGKSWFPFDQIDYVLGAIIITLPLAQLKLSHYLWMIVIWSTLHLLANYVGWRMGMRDEPI